MPSEVICDFCSSPNVVKQYQCLDFRSDSEDVGVVYGGVGVTLDSDSFWAACEECAAFVDREDLDGLLARVIKVFSLSYGRLKPGLITHFEHTYQLFFENRIRIKGE